MKETKKIEDYYITSRIVDYSGQWFYGLFGWKYIKTDSHQNHYAEKKTYLVSDGNDRLRLEDKYEHSSGGYDLCHTFERDTNDPRYEKYCELERRICLIMDIWEYYPLVKNKLDKMFSGKTPMEYTQHKKRFTKYYVYGVVLLIILAIMMVVMQVDPGYFSDSGIPMSAYNIAYLLILGLPGAACIIRGIVGHVRSCDLMRTIEEYQRYLDNWFAGKPEREMCAIIKEAMETKLYH